MSTFTLANSCLTTSNLPWFMNLTFQVPMQYCSLQHQTLLPSSVTSTTGCCFCFGSNPSFFSGVISPVISSSLLGTYQLGEFIFQCLIFLPFHIVHGVLREGNGNPLQSSFLENPMDRGAWWAAMYGVAQSRKQLTWLSSSSISMGFSRHEYWSGLPFPSPVDCILSDLSTMTCAFWVTPHSMA